MKIFNWKHRHFQKKIKGVKKVILDTEFKREKTRMIREEIRQEYDALRSKLNSIETTIKIDNEATKENKMEEGEFKRLEDRKVLLENDITRLKAQIDALDVEVSGSKPCPEYPEGADGLTQQIDALRELVVMLKNYKRKL